jgi:hypothetical protein
MSNRIPGLRAAVVLGIIVILVGIGTGSSFAAWTAATSKGATATAATTALSTAGIDALATTYKPGLAGVTTATLSDTVPVTVTNTGSTPLGYALTVTGGNATVNGAIALQVWKAGATCDATTAPAAGATANTLAAPPALPADANSAAIGGVVSLCLRTTISAANQATYTGTSTAPTLAVVGSVGTWTTSSAVTFTQTITFSWFQLVHENSGKCVASAGTAVAAGTAIVIGTCKPLVATNNQALRFVQQGTTGTYRIYIGAGTASGPVLATPGTNSGTPVQLAAVDTVFTANNQLWTIVASGDPGDFRIVLRGNPFALSTLCLTSTATADGSAFTAVTCNTTALSGSPAYKSQRFNFVEVS